MLCYQVSDKGLHLFIQHKSFESLVIPVGFRGLGNAELACQISH